MSIRGRVVTRVLELDRGPLAGALGIGASIYESLKHRERRRVRVDRDGDWTYATRDTALTTPRITLMEPDAWVRMSEDYWFHAFRPRPGDVVLDVGAGIGDDALAFSRAVGPKGKVIAVEAHPRTFGCLRKTIAHAGVTNVVAVHAAAGEREGTVRISDDDDYLVNHLGASRDGHEVRALTLDALLSELGVTHVDFLKMNIEGAETGALTGSPALLARVPRVAIACHDFVADAGGRPECRTRADVGALLARVGFEVTTRDDARAWVRDHLYGRRAS